MVTFFQNLNEILLSDSINFGIIFKFVALMNFLVAFLTRFSAIDFLWPVVEVIDIAIQNIETRQYLLDSVRIITGISNFAMKACNLNEVSAKISKEKKFRNSKKIVLLL